MPKMREAERGPMIEILSRFNDIHRDDRVRENFELFRHVVFDLAGAYYVAVPLDAPPESDPRLREEMRVEVQLLANLFTSFEKDRIFKRTWTPFTGTVQAKLRKQGSKFARSQAFRVYRFTDGAWPEIILGAVMGAARRVEAREAALDDKADATARRTARPADPRDMQLPDPLLDDTSTKRTQSERRKPATPSPRPEPVPQRDERRAPDPRFAAEFWSACAGSRERVRSASIACLRGGERPQGRAAGISRGSPPTATLRLCRGLLQRRPGRMDHRPIASMSCSSGRRPPSHCRGTDWKRSTR